MKQRGFSYPVNDSADDASTALDDDRPHPFGLEDLAPHRPVAPPIVEEPASAEITSERYTQALYGSDADRLTAKGDVLMVTQPGSGCLAQAAVQLLGDARQRWMETRIRLGEAQARALDTLQSDAAYHTLNDRWRTCMSRAGMHYKDPTQLLRSLPPTPDLSTDKRAQTDLKCKQQTNYLTTGYARLTVLQTAELNKNPNLLIDWNNLLRRQLAIAHDVLHNNGNEADSHRADRPRGRDCCDNAL